MNQKKNGVLLLLLCGALLVAAQPKQQSKGDDVPRASVLAAIIEAFAYNLSEDGKQPQPRLTHTAHVGQMFDEFGKRSTIGASYKRAFAREFSELGAQLRDAMGLVDEVRPLPLTNQRRSAAVKTLEAFASRLKDGAL